MKAKRKGPSLLKRIMIRTVAYGMALVMLAGTAGAVAYRQSDNFIFDKVVQIKGSEGGSCSGEQVKAPSGKEYIMTAAHCRSLVEDGNGTVVTEDGKEHKAIFIAEDINSDLMILKGIKGIGSLSIAKKAEDRQHIRTYTHGAGMKAYRTDGVLIETQLIQIMIDMIFSQAEFDACLSMPKQQVAIIMEVIPVCILSVEETASTAFTAPGSSGGAVVDSKGRLVGVVSAGGGGYSFFVTLSDIQAFMSDK